MTYHALGHKKMMPRPPRMHAPCLRHLPSSATALNPMTSAVGQNSLNSVSSCCRSNSIEPAIAAGRTLGRGVARRWLVPILAAPPLPVCGDARSLHSPFTAECVCAARSAATMFIISRSYQTAVCKQSSSVASNMCAQMSSSVAPDSTACYQFLWFVC